MIGNTLLLAIREIRRNLLRSFLTILGIVIGVSAVITMVTLGRGATQAVQAQIASLGTNLLQIRPGQRMGPGGGGSGAPAFREADLDAIATQIAGVAAVAPEARSSVTVVAGARNWSTSVTGTTNAWLRTGTAAPPPARPSLYEANARLTAWQAEGASVRFSLQGHAPLEFSLRDAGACQVRADGRALSPLSSSRASGPAARAYRLSHAAADIQVQCPAR